METGVTDYSQRGPSRPPFARLACLPALTRWLLSLLLFLTGWTSSAAEQQNLQPAPIAPLPAIVAPPQNVQPRLTLTATPNQVAAGSRVRFDASWDREIEASLLYKLWVNGEAVAQWSDAGTHTHRFGQAGNYRVQVTAQRISQDDVQPIVGRSNMVSVTVLPELSVRITQPDMPVRAGETAVFVAQVSPDVPVRYRWQGPGEQTSQSRVFRVDTSGLSSGQYAVEVAVVDDRQQIARAGTTLRVEVVYQKPAARISPETLSRVQGEEAVFRARYRADPGLEVERRWDGPAGVSYNSDSYAVPTQHLEPGDHSIHYQVSDSQGQEASAEAKLHIEAAYIKPAARISPPTLTLIQGKQALFRARHRVDPRLEAETRWEGPAGSSDNPNSYAVATHDLEPGSHAIRYLVRDSRGQVARAEAELRIEAAFRKPVARIRPETLTLTQGEEAVFQGSYETDPRLEISGRRWNGPDGRRENTDSYTLPTHDLAAGDHPIRFEVVDAQGQVARARAQLSIIPAPALRIEIMPPQQRLLPGDHVRFGAVVHDDGSRRYAYRWTGPGDREATGDSFAVTADAALIGDHEITLRVSDDLGRSATAHAGLHITAPVLSLHRESDNNIDAGGTVLLWGVVTPDAPVENLRLHIGAEEAGRPIELDVPYPISFDTPGDFRVYLTGRLADLRLESQPQFIRVGSAPTPFGDDLPWLLWGSAGLAAFAGLGWWLRQRLKPPVSPPRISVAVNPNFDQWDGGFEHTADPDLGVRLAVVVDPGEQTWDEEPGASTR